MSNHGNNTLSYYASLTSLCCLIHFMNHLGPTDFGYSWWLAVAVIVAACGTFWRFTMRRFFVLLSLQAAHVLIDAPFNPDHWLLLFFVNITIGMSALHLRLRGEQVTPSGLYASFAPAARLTFLICYGYAAFSKLNSHFLDPSGSCAAVLAEIQFVVSPWLKHVSVPAIAGWLTAIAECTIALLLIPQRTRRYGIMMGLVFHTMLVISPAIAVFDFTVTIYTMVFLFAGEDVGERLNQLAHRCRKQIPALWPLLMSAKTYGVIGLGLLMILRTALGYPMFGDARLGNLSWLLYMAFAAVVIGVGWKVLFAEATETPRSEARLLPRVNWHFAVILLALFNGACPYLGLKTQGSFTMFSNLQTEAGYWNHLLVPRWVRVFDAYQDDLVQVASVGDKRLQADFVDRDCLVPRFEIRRAAMKNPNMPITVIRDQKQIQLDPISIDTELSEPLSWFDRKLLIFRPVTPDGMPYCGN